MCICGDFDCEEQSHISKLFPEPRPSLKEYRSGLTDSGLRTSAKNSVYRFDKNILNIQAVDVNGNSRKTGGDFWIARLKGVLRERSTQLSIETLRSQTHTSSEIFIAPHSKTDHGTGSYIFEFPNVRNYSKNFKITLEVFLERSFILHEVNRRAMASYHLVGRLMNVMVPTRPTTNRYRHEHKLAQCSMFPLKKACNFSESLARTWYCYHNDAVCTGLEKSLKFMVTRTTSDSYGVSSILKSCSNNTFTKKGSETDFQKVGYKTEYNPVLNEPDSADFPHWILGKYTQKARNIKSLLQTQ